MDSLTRRGFGGVALLLANSPRVLAGSNGIDDTLRKSAAKEKIPSVVAMVASADKIIFTGAVGMRDSASGIAVNAASIYRIHSMTKPVTSAAAMQLVEQGRLKLDEPAAKYLPELAHVNVLDGFDSAGKPILRPARKPLTLRLLLTHTAGFAYEFLDANLSRYTKQHSSGASDVAPLMFEPGARWQYGTSVDWAGRLVEAISGLTLEQYFQRNIFEPLGMRDTSFILPPEKFDRLVSAYNRQPTGLWKETPRTQPPVPKVFNGGGGLLSTASDYVRFMQMILQQGRSSGGQEILKPATVAAMAANQIGPLRAGLLKSVDATLSADVDFHPGFNDKFGFGFLINTDPYQGGRAAGSLAWAGLENTFFWIDPRRNVCAVVLMQFLPFADATAIALLRDFEQAVYATLS
jgi:methyl acetate hydrolase